MRIREYTPADLDALRELHAKQNFGYAFPDVDSPLFVCKLILEDDADDTSGADFLPRAKARGSPRAGSESREEASGREAAHGNAAAAQSPAESQFMAQESLAASHASAPAAPPRDHSPRILMAVLLRLTAETYLLYDPTAGTPRERWQNLLALHEVARHSAAARGFDDVQAFLPPRIARAFGRRLARLGWRQDPWPSFTRTTGG